MIGGSWNMAEYSLNKAQTKVLDFWYGTLKYGNL